MTLNRDRVFGGQPLFSYGGSRRGSRATASDAAKNDSWDYFAALALALFILWPPYAYIKLGPLPAFTPYTASMIILLLMAIPAMAVLKKLDRPIFSGLSTNHFMVAALILWVLWRILSDSVGLNPKYSIGRTMRDIVYINALFFSGLILSRTTASVRLALRTLVICTFIVILIAIIERILRQTILVVLGLDFSGGDQVGWRLATGGIYRLSEYRVQSTFSNPIVLGEFLAAMIPILIYLIRTGSRNWRWLAIATLAMLPLPLYLTRARSALIAALVALVVYGALKLPALARRSTAGGMLAICVLIFGILTGFMTQSVLEGLVQGRDAEEASSTTARLMMFERARAGLQGSPVWGFGDGSAATIAGFRTARDVLTIDSYILTVMLDFGLVGLALWLSVMVMGIGNAARHAITHPKPASRDLLGAITATSTAIAVTQVILSIPDSLGFYYFLIPITWTLVSAGGKPANARSKIRPAT